MFAFIDESGHTGQNIKDEKQPILYYMAMLSKYNIGLLSNEKINRICREMNIERLHGSELGKNSELIAGSIFDVLREYSPRFFIAEIEKRYFALAKLFDTLFDSGENLGARNHVYSFRTLRLLLLFNFSQIVDEDLAYYFYDNCLFADSQDNANKALIYVCKELDDRLIGQFDERSNELIHDVLIWASNHPNALTTFESSKEERWMHLPNVAAFVPTMQLMAYEAKKNNTYIHKIIHDEQIQLKNILEAAHRFSSNPNAPIVYKFLDNPEVRFKELKKSSFQITSSKENTGLQIVDFVLYNWKKKDVLLRNPIENRNSVNLLRYYSERTAHFQLTYKQLFKECKSIMEWISQLPISSDQYKQGEKIVRSIEEKFEENKLKSEA